MILTNALRSKPVYPMNVLNNKPYSHYLNLRGVKCPLNYVKTKLFLDKIDANDYLYLTIDAGEATESVIKSIETDGNKLIKLEPNHEFNLLTIQKLH